MSVSDDYRRQSAWRPWAEIFAASPPIAGHTVLDLGCGVGDQTAELVARGARVIGIDMNDELLATARGRGLERAEFRSADLRAPLTLGARVDGIWCSFAAAYFPDLAPVLRSWATALWPGGWIALTEVDDLFGHEPVAERTRAAFAGYAREALAAGRYDFLMGRKLRGHLERAGLAVERERVLGDQELSFTGPALPEVVDAWRTRLGRMKLLQDFCGADFAEVRDDFLACLQRADHRSLAKVVCCLARAEG